ncbi:hypothetical protein F4810DRAFT_715761 [Camillea tinctor]|nr:hypothetical protein F4810DRAFT_715761 [Camillea tinctor]
MAPNDFDSELQSLSIDELRALVQQMRTSDTNPNTTDVNDGNQNGDGHTDKVETKTQEAPKGVNHCQSGGGKGKEVAREDTLPSTMMPSSSTLVASPHSTENNGSSSLRSTGQLPRPHLNRTDNLTAAEAQRVLGMRDVESVQRCGRCYQWYTESHNSSLACAFHPGRVHFREAETIAYIPTYPGWEHRYVPSSFRWQCCGHQVGVSAGCVNTRHNAAAAPPANCQPTPESYHTAPVRSE